MLKEKKENGKFGIMNGKTNLISRLHDPVQRSCSEGDFSEGEFGFKFDRFSILFLSTRRVQFKFVAVWPQSMILLCKN